MKGKDTNHGKTIYDNMAVYKNFSGIFYEFEVPDSTSETGGNQ